MPSWAIARQVRRSPSAGEGVVTAFRDGQVTLRRNRRTEGFTEAIQEHGYQGVRRGELVIHSMDGFAGAIGVSDSDGKMSPVAHIYSVREGEPRYFALLLRVMALGGFVESLAKGIRERSTAFDRAAFKSLSIPVPPADEQRAILAFLDRETAQIDAFIAKNEELIVLLTERRASAVSELVSLGLDRSARMNDSGVSWLGPVPEHWRIVRARYLCTVGTGDGDTIDAIDEGEYPFYVRSDTPQRSNRFGFDTEAVLTSGDGAGVGKVFHLVDGKFAAHQRVYVLHSFQHVSASFFYRYFATYFGVVALDGSAKSTVDSVRRHMITDMPIAVPPADEQSAIVAAVESTAARIDAAILTARRSVELARERRAALISAAVTGKIDVGVAA